MMSHTAIKLRALLIRYPIRFLVVGLALSAGSLWLLVTLAKSAITGPTLTGFDTNLIDGLYLQTNPTARAILQVIDLVGSEGVMIFGVLVGLLFARRGQWYYLAVWAIALLGGNWLNSLLKETAARPRPVFEEMWVTEDTYGFPSGHAMTAVLVSGMVAYFLVIRTRSMRRRALILGIAALVVVIIGSSRLFLGLHYFSDVLAGVVAGGIWLATCITALEVLRWQNSHLGARREE